MPERTNSGLRGLPRIKTSVDHGSENAPLLNREAASRDKKSNAMSRYVVPALGGACPPRPLPRLLRAILARETYVRYDPSTRRVLTRVPPPRAPRLLPTSVHAFPPLAGALVLTLVTLTATHHSSLPAGGYDAVASMDAADTRAALAAMTQPAVEEEEEEILDAAVDAPEMETGDVAVAAEGEVARAVNAAGAATSPPRAPKRRAQRLAYRSPFESELEVSGDASSEDADARRKYRRLKYTRHARSGSMSDSESFDPSSIDPAAFGLEAGAEMSSGGAGAGEPRTSGLGDAFDSYAALVLEDVAEYEAKYGGGRAAAVEEAASHNPAVKLIGVESGAKESGAKLAALDLILSDGARRDAMLARAAGEIRRRGGDRSRETAQRVARDARVGGWGNVLRGMAAEADAAARHPDPEEFRPSVGAAEGPSPAEAEAEGPSSAEEPVDELAEAFAALAPGPAAAADVGFEDAHWADDDYRTEVVSTKDPYAENRLDPIVTAPGKPSEKTDDPVMKALLERVEANKEALATNAVDDDGEFHEDRFIAELVDEGLVLAPEEEPERSKATYSGGYLEGGFDGDDLRRIVNDDSEMSEDERANTFPHLALEDADAPAPEPEEEEAPAPAPEPEEEEEEEEEGAPAPAPEDGGEYEPADAPAPA